MKTTRPGSPMLRPRDIAAWLSLLVLMGLAGCTTTPYGGAPGSDRYAQRHDSAPDGSVDVSKLPEPVPHPLKRSPYGNPSSYTVNGHTYHVLDTAAGYDATGIASWYGRKFNGYRTSSGETYDMYKFTAANKTLPLPSWARVTNLDNGRSVIVKVNDRGPFHPGRIIDLSWAAAVKLGISKTGTGRVRVQTIMPGDSPAMQQAKQTPEQDHVVAVAAHPKPSDGLYLQVGAYSHKASARDVVTRLVGHFSYPVGVHAADNLFRVWVGPFDSDNDRNRALQALEAAGFGEPIAISR